MPIARVPRPSPSMIVAVIALVAAVSGNAIAGVSQHAASTKHKPRVKLAIRNTVGSSAVIDNSLLLKDFKSSERAKLVGPKGPAGTPDTSSFYDKAASDGRFLGQSAKATDSAQLGGVAASDYTRGDGSQNAAFQVLLNQSSNETFLSIGAFAHLSVSCSGTPTITLVSDAPSQIRLNATMVNGSGAPVVSGFGVSPGGSYPATLGPKGQIVIQAHRDPAPGLVSSDDVTITAMVVTGAPLDGGTSCRWTASYVISHHAGN